MSRAEIQAVLQPHVRTSGRSLTALVWIYLAVAIIALIFESMHIYAFRDHPTMLGAGLAATLVTLGIIAFGIHILRDLASTELSDENLLERLRHRMRLYRTKLNLWLWSVALSWVCLTFAVSTLRHSQEEYYVIEQPLIFAAVLAIQLVLGYTILKIGNSLMVRESEAILSDLENQVTEKTGQMQAWKKRWAIWAGCFVVLGVILFFWLMLRSLV